MIVSIPDLCTLTYLEHWFCTGATQVPFPAMACYALLSYSYHGVRLGLTSEIAPWFRLKRLSVIYADFFEEGGGGVTGQALSSFYLNKVRFPIASSIYIQSLTTASESRR